MLATRIVGAVGCGGLFAFASRNHFLISDRGTPTAALDLTATRTHNGRETRLRRFSNLIFRFADHHIILLLLLLLLLLLFSH